MDTYKRYKFVKELKVKEGTFPIGSEITIMNDRIYFNGGQIQPSFYDLFYDLIEYETIKGFNYLKEVPIPYNKL